ncbi:O-antigen ligase family protein [Verticiella sediminum]|uniref:O-antigen ligase family protein n=1 Tax=Verticiella sediminum TaxID=1247510 RepID=A0A556AYZ1_9BURK|nr:O-antigen ligase family protein [Verticiella sediminum]TSH98159.1 O-antigen ligase family protein [Verticiella sediminum]
MSRARPPEAARAAAREGAGSSDRRARPPEAARAAAREGAGSSDLRAQPPGPARAAACPGGGAPVPPFGTPSGGARACVANGAAWVAWAAAVMLPALTLVMRGHTNAAYFFIALSTLAGAWATRGAGRVDGPAFRADFGWLSLACAAPFIAVLWNQIVLGEFADRPYDAPARLAFAGAAAWWLAQIPYGRLRHVQWGLCAGAMAGMLALLAATHHDRPEPPFATAITFGNLSLLMGLCAWLALGWRLSRMPRLEALLKVAAGFCGVYASFLSQSRGGWLALPAVALMLLLLWRGHWRAKTIGALASLAFLGGIYLGSPMVQQRVAQASTELVDYLQGRHTDSSVGLRLQFWEASLEMFASRPMTGVGPQNVRAGFQARASAGELDAAAARFTHSHNDVLWAMAGLGLPGLLALFALYAVPLAIFVRVARRGAPPQQAAACMGATVVVCFAVFGLTEAMFAITMNAAFYAGMIAIFLALCKESVPTRC